jgi:hypothetical protein|tara:strand:+ start:599 stop:847 length:249 start_codon:yes stop_codon:yes gene_type:complete
MSIERQPAVLATKNMRNAASQFQRNKASVEPQTRKGLLSPNNVLQSRTKTEETTRNESQRVLDYILDIREAMLVDESIEESV